DELVRVAQIDEHIALGIAAADDLHLLEEQRTPLAVNLIALLELALERNRSDLPAGKRGFRALLGEARPARPAADLRYGEMTGNTINQRIIDRVGRELGV